MLNGGWAVGVDAHLNLVGHEQLGRGQTEQEVEEDHRHNGDHDGEVTDDGAHLQHHAQTTSLPPHQNTHIHARRPQRATLKKQPYVARQQNADDVT